MGRPKKIVPEESELESLEDLDEEEEEENEAPLEPEEEAVDLEVMREDFTKFQKKLLDCINGISVNQKYIRKIFEKHKELENNFKLLLEKIN